MKKESKLTRKRLLRYAIQGLVLGILATTAVLIYFTEPEATLAHLKEFDWKYGFVCLGLILIAWLCNGLRIYILSRSMGYAIRFRQAISISLSAEFGIAATPAGMGGAVIRLSLLRMAGVSVGHGTSMLATDMALDFLFFLLLLPFAAYSIMNNPRFARIFHWREPGEYIVGLVVLAVVLFIFLFLVRSGLLGRLISNLSRLERMRHHRISARLRLLRWRVNGEMRRMKQGMVHLIHLHKGAILLTFLVASLQWCCRYGTLSLLLSAFQIPNNPVVLFFLQGILFSVSLLVVLPGGGGGVEVLMALALRQMIPPSLVGIVILLWRFYTYYLYLFGGGAVFLWTFAHLRRVFPKASENASGEAEFELEQERLNQVHSA